jgi:AcrR family transcriptional regulator
MPTPARTSHDEIVAAARRIAERDGLDALTMAAVAQAVGVRAPSLYKRVDGRPALVRLVVEDAVGELTALLETHARGTDPRRVLVAQARAFRRFAHARPNTYGVLFARLPPESRPDPELYARAAAPVLRATAALAGPERALEAARTVVAWAHGFLTMELGGAFQLGGDVDAAFAFGIRSIVRSIEAAD